jgi:hypothetical protein
MGVSEYMALGMFVVTVLFGVIGFLLSRKDTKQEETIHENKEAVDKLIADLYAKHEDDSRKLEALAIDVAKNYNPKHEITDLFGTFRLYLNERFDRLEQAMGIERRHIK